MRQCAAREHSEIRNKSGRSRRVISIRPQDSPADRESFTQIQKHEGATRGQGSGNSDGAQVHQLGSQPGRDVRQVGIFEELGIKLVCTVAGKLHNKPTVNGANIVNFEPMSYGAEAKCRHESSEEASAQKHLGHSTRVILDVMAGSPGG